MAEWKLWQGIIVLVLVVSGVGTYYLQSTGKSDICTSGGVRGVWIKTDWGENGYYRYACWKEKDNQGNYPKVRWCENVTDYGGVKNARCYTMKEVYYESPTSENDSLTKWDGTFLGGSEIPPSAKDKEYFDRDSGMVYECDAVENDGKDDQCKNPVLVGKPEVEHVFKNGDYLNKPVLKNVTLKNLANITGGWLHIDENGIVFTKYQRIEGNSQTMWERYILEDDIAKTIEQARELNESDSIYINRLEDDGKNDMSYGAYNLTEMDIYLMPEGKGTPFKINGNEYTTVDSPQWVHVREADGLLGINWTLGNHSTTDTILWNTNESFKTVYLSGFSPDNNFGDTTLDRQVYCDTGDCRGHNLLFDDFDTFLNAGGGSVTLENYTTILTVKAKYGEMSFDICLLMTNWSRGSESNQPGNASLRNPRNNNGGDTGQAWTDEPWVEGVIQVASIKPQYLRCGLGHYDFPDNTGEIAIEVTNLTELQNVLDGTVEYYGLVFNVSVGKPTSGDWGFVYYSEGGASPPKTYTKYTILPPSFLVKQWAEVQSIDSTTITYNLTIFVYNNHTSSLTVTLDPDDGFSTNTYSMTLTSGEENTTQFENITTRGTSDITFYVQPPSITGDTTATGNGLHLVGPGQVGAVAADRFGKCKIVEVQDEI